MPRPRILVLRAAGINCDEETAFAWELAGGQTKKLHINQLIAAPDPLDDYQILNIPGGFSYGDDIASGRILGNQLVHHLGDAISRFLERGGLVLGICNGFQVLVRAGLLPGKDSPVRTSLMLNQSGRYEDRWVTLQASATNSPFLEPGETFHLPVAHAEGRLVIDGGPVNTPRLEQSGRIALRYTASDGREPVYPENPNGSIGNAAGLVDSTGRILGLMPHPERAVHACQFPEHLRDISVEMGGLKLFQRAVLAFE